MSREGEIDRDITERLREAFVGESVFIPGEWPDGGYSIEPTKLGEEAAGEIEFLRKERDEAKAACRAMAREIERLKDDTPEFCSFTFPEEITVSRVVQTCGELYVVDADGRTVKLTRSIGS